MGIYNFIHKKSAAGHVSGVTEESNIDIIEGEYTLAGVKTGIKWEAKGHRVRFVN